MMPSRRALFASVVFCFGVSILLALWLIEPIVTVPR